MQLLILMACYEQTVAKIGSSDIHPLKRCCLLVGMNFQLSILLKIFLVVSLQFHKIIDPRVYFVTPKILFGHFHTYGMKLSLKFSPRNLCTIFPFFFYVTGKCKSFFHGGQITHRQQVLAVNFTSSYTLTVSLSIYQTIVFYDFHFFP